MIFKNGKQIGFIYKGNKPIDKLIKNDKVVFEQGFTRTITGISPLSFGGVGKPLKDYRIKGNTEQYTQEKTIENKRGEEISINDFDTNRQNFLKIEGNTFQESRETSDREFNDVNTISFENDDLENQNYLTVYGNTYQEQKAEKKEIFEDTGSVIFNNTSLTNDNQLTIYGETVQETTTGKNILNYNDLRTDFGGKGLELELDENGVFTISGKPTSNYVSFLSFNINNILEDGETYVLVVDEKNILFYAQVVATNRETGANSYYTTQNTKVYEFTVNKTTYKNYAINIQAGKTSDWGDAERIIQNRFMICKKQTDLSFEKYTGGIPSPNPDYPQEIESVGELVNLFDKNNTDYIKNWLIVNSTQKITSGSNETSIIFECEPNKTYIINKLSGARCRVGDLPTFPKVDDVVNNYSISSNENVTTYKFTTSSTAKYCVVGVLYTDSSTTITLQQMLDSIIIYEEGKKYKIPVNVSSKNLYVDSQDFSGTWIYNSYWETDTETYNNCVVKKRKQSWNGISKRFQIEKGKTYTFSLYAKADISRNSALYVNETDKLINPENKAITLTTEWTRYSFTFTAIESGIVRPRLENKTDVDGYTYICCYQLEEGSVATDYQPYHNEKKYVYLDAPLRKIGGYADYIDFENGEVVRNIGERILVGDTEDWSIYETVVGKQFQLYIPSMKIGNNNKIGVTSDKFRGIAFSDRNTSGMNTIYSWSGDKVLRLLSDVATTVNGFKSWLSQNNVTVDYILETPTTEKIDLPQIEYIENTNIVSTETKIEPKIKIESFESHASPTPDYPQEIESVGDLTTNELNIYARYGKNTSLENNGITYYVKDDGTILANGTATSESVFFILSNTQLGQDAFMGDFYYSGCTGGSDTTYQMTFWISGKGTYTLLDGELKVKKDVVNNWNMAIIIKSGTKVDNVVFKPMLNKIPNQNFEPYGKYKIPVNVSSENLVGLQDVIETIKGNLTYSVKDDELTINGTNTSTVYLSIPLKKSITLDGSYIHQVYFGDFTTANINANYRLNTSAQDYLNVNLKSQRLRRQTVSSNVEVKILYLQILPQTFNDFKVKFQLTKGTTETDYQPYYNETTNIYLDQPLRKIGDYADYINFENGEIIRNVKEVILDGGETWQFINNAYQTDRAYPVDVLTRTETTFAFCNKYKYAYYNTAMTTNIKKGEFGWNAARYLTISYNGKTIDEFKTWLSQNNVTIDYVLETSVSEKIDLPTIPYIEGVNILTVGANLDKNIKLNQTLAAQPNPNTPKEIQSVGEEYHKEETYNENDEIFIETTLENSSLEDYKIYGNTKQNTTTGKNLLDLSSIETNKNGMTLNYDKSTGILTLNGTCTTDNTVMKISNNYTLNGTMTLKTKYINGTYENITDTTMFMLLNNSNWNGLGVKLTNDNKTYTKTLYNLTTNWNCIRVDKDVTFNNYKIMIQLCNDENDEVEPYTNGASPNPDYPQEIESVGELNNLFDGEVEIGSYNNDTGIKTTNENMIRSTNYINIEQNTNYNFEINNKLNLLSSRYFFYDVNKNYLSNIQTSTGQITTPNNAKYLTFHSTGLKTNYETNLPNAIIYEEGKKYKISVTVRSENLEIVDRDNNTVNGLTVTNNKDGSLTINGTATAQTNFNLTKTYRTQYFYDNYITFYCDNLIDGMSLQHWYRPSTSSSSMNLGNVYYNRKLLNKAITENEFENYRAILTINENTVCNNLTIKPMLLDGLYNEQNLPLYQPYYNETTYVYLDQPLRKIDEYADYINFENGEVVRNIKEIILNGSETWYIEDANRFRTKDFQGIIKPPIENNILANALSSRFKIKIATKTWSEQDDAFSIDKTGQINIRYNTCKTSDELKTWLSNNNVAVNCVLLEPTIEKVDLPIIPLIKGVNNISAETTTQPSQIELKYNTGKYQVPVKVNDNTYNVILDAPLRKIGEYQDYIDWEGSKVYRNINEIIFNGTEDWSFNYNNSMFRAPLENIKPRQSSYSKSNFIISSHYTNEIYNDMYTLIKNKGIEVGESTNKYIYIRDKDILTVNDFKNWLSQSNLIMNYVLELPIEENIDLNTIQYTSGANTISAETAIKPTFDLTYNYQPQIPSPEFPSEIESVGDKCKNIFNISLKNGQIGSNGAFVNSTVRLTNVSTAKDFITPIKKGIYTISCENLYACTLLTKNLDNEIINNYANSWQNLPFTFEITQDSYLFFTLKANNDITLNPNNYNVIINEGNVVNGYKIPVNVSSENLLKQKNNGIGECNNNGLTISRDSNGIITINGTSVENNSYIDLSDVSHLMTGWNDATFIDLDNKTLYFRYFYESGTLSTLGQFNTFTFGVRKTTSDNITLSVVTTNYNNDKNKILSNVGNRKVYIYIPTGMIFNNFKFKVDIVDELNKTYSPYYNETTNIYLDQPLRKIGNYADYIDFKNGEVVRNIKEIKLSNMNFLSAGQPNVNYSSQIKDYKISNEKICICNNFISVNNVGGASGMNNSSLETCAFINNNSAIRFYIKSKMTSNELNNFIENNNITINYVLAEPIKENIELPIIETAKGNNILTINTTTLPSEIFLKYKSNK